MRTEDKKKERHGDRSGQPQPQQWPGQGQPAKQAPAKTGQPGQPGGWPTQPSQPGKGY